MTGQIQQEGLDAAKLKRDLLLSYLSLSSLGIIILLLGVFATLGLRDYALALLEQSAPRVEAVEKLQKGLEISISNLRGWMAFEDPRYKQEKQTAWQDVIYPALKALQKLEQSNNERSTELQVVEEQLKNLELWQWHIEDVVHTPGNIPGQWLYDSKIALLLPEILSATEALLNLEINAGRNVVADPAVLILMEQIVQLRSAVFLASTHLKSFVKEGLLFDKTEYHRDLNKAETIYQIIVSQQFRFGQEQLEQLSMLQQSLAALKHFAVKAIVQVESENPNIANFWLNTICLPAVADLNAVLKSFAAQERQRMQSDTANIKWIAMLVPWLMAALLLLMISISVYLARKRTQQFIEPVLLLEKQDQLKTDIAELNNTSHGTSDIKELCTQCLTYIAEQVNCSAAAIYLFKDDVLRLSAGYALPKSILYASNVIEPGEGLVGQVYLSQKRMSLSASKHHPFTINTSLLEVVPGQIVIAPILYEKQVLAVLELAVLDNFNAYDNEFIDLSLEQVGIILNDASQKEIIKEALSQSQAQTEELQAQTEELQAQTEELQAQQEELQAQQEELRVTNEEISSKSQILESQKMAIQQKVQELEESSRYKSEFLANMSHELRTPLNSLLLLSKSLADNKKGHLDTTEVEDAEVIYDGGNSLLALINDILDLSKVEAGKLNMHVETVNIDNLTRNLEKTFKPIAKKRGLSFYIEKNENLPRSINSDSLRIEQVLRNLLSNAMKFTMNGSVTLNVAYAEPQVKLTQPDLNARTALAFAVVDTGIGIPAEKQKAIFEAFQQQDGSTSRKYGGTGLGLTIARELTRLLGGEIQLYSTLGEGSCFTFYVPIEMLVEDSEEDLDLKPGAELTALSPITARSIAPSRLNTQGNEETIESGPAIQAYPDFIPDDRNDLQEADRILLVIDDDKKFARTLRNSTRDNGYKCLVAGDGRTGIYLAKLYQPHGIILDIGLPDIDGHQVLEQLKFSLKTRHIPVQVISAYDGSKSNALVQGAMGFLTKPVKEEQLHQVLSEIAEIIKTDVRQILLVEDDASNQKATTRLLENTGINIHCVATGSDACDEILSDKYDCVILDLGLPDMTGFEVLKFINESQLHRIPPVIIYTGKEISDSEQAELDRYSSSIVIKGAGSAERLLDDVSLFLHNIESRFKNESQQKTMHQLHDEDAMLKERKILLVDDDMRNTYALSKQLIEIGCDVEMANNGVEAVELLENDLTYELVLMDTMMPLMDGNEATRQIRQMKHYKSIPIIALTAKTMPEDREKCLQAGASEYLTKPIDFEKLLSIMRIWLFKRA